MTLKLTDKQIQHLYWRAGFGITYSELQVVRSFSKQQIVDDLFSKSKKIQLLQLDLSMLDKNPKELSKEQKIDLRKLRGKKLHELNLLWFKQMKITEGVLLERMTLFFQNHFSVRIKFPRYVMDLHNTIRKNALGNFGELLMHVSKSPAVLSFLNAKQNRKGHPNENFAREVMELFTLGRDNGYIENDIKEAARAFTGWNYDRKGTFIFKGKQHDVGSKTFLGSTGDLNGDAIIRLLLKEKQTAKYLSLKLYKYLVNDIPEEAHVEAMAKSFYESNYDIKTWLSTIFMSDWFYDAKNIGSKIKSPVDLITGLDRQFDINYSGPKALIFLQRQLNQIVFYPPNVAGWVGGKNWIDNSTLMIRLKVASVILNDGFIDISVKDNMPEEMIMMQRKKDKMKKKGIKNGIGKSLKATANWELFLASISGASKEKLVDFFIQPSLSNTANNMVRNATQYDTKKFMVALLSLPEYQLC